MATLAPSAPNRPLGPTPRNLHERLAVSILQPVPQHRPVGLGGQVSPDFDNQVRCGGSKEYENWVLPLLGLTEGGCRGGGRPQTGSQRQRVPLDSCPDVGLESVVGKEVDWAAENLLQLALEACEPYEPNRGLKVHEKVDIAVRPVLAPSRAAE